MQTEMQKQAREAAAEAFSDLQTPGVTTTITTGNGRTATFDDPHALLRELCDAVKVTESATDPWPFEDDEPVEFVRSEIAESVGSQLINGIHRLAPLTMFRIHYLFRYKDNWTSKGRKVLGQMKRPTGLLREYASTDYIVLLNWKAWKLMNPMQRVAIIYHELRHANAEGKIRGHDFEGFFDELKLFGTDTYEDWQSLAEAADRGGRVQHQFSLDLDAFNGTAADGGTDEAA